MASINSISVKNLSDFPGHDGCICYRGELYLEDNRIGYWSQNYMGGIDDNISLAPQYDERKLRSAVSQKNKDKIRTTVSRDGSIYQIEYMLEDLLCDLIKLITVEKVYKAAEQKGITDLLLLTDGYHMLFYEISKEQVGPVCLRAFKKEIDKTFYSNKKISVKYYTSDDFDIGEPIKEAEILI